jgi:hypothetical protein
MIRSLKASGYRYSVPEGLSVLDLTEKPLERVWNDHFQKHDRQSVKYFERMGAQFVFARTEQDYGDYLALHGESIARGKERPLLPQEFLSRMRLNIGEQVKVALVRLDEKLVAGFTMICDPLNSIVHLQIIGYSRAKNIHSAVVYIDWQAVNWAHKNGFRYVDFGPTSSNPANAVHKLKARMGGTFIPIYRFTLYTAGSPYSFAKRLSRTARDVKSAIS